jgi:methionyl-tRNA synthetase
VLESVRLAAYWLSPITPNLSTAIYEQLGFSVNFNDQQLSDVSTQFGTHARWGTLLQQQTLSQPFPVFKRLEVSSELNCIQQAGKSS